MKVLFDIGHPAHVHLFKNLAWKLIEEGDQVLFTCREKEFEIDLLSAYGFNYYSFGKKYSSKIGKILGMFKFDVQMFIVALRFRPDYFVSHGSIYAAQVSWLMGKPHIALEDSGNMEQIRLYRPFTSVILTPDVLSEDLGEKQIRYTGYHELAYLWPTLFKPNNLVLKILGVNDNDKYAILRFVSWNATHDKGQEGLSFQQKVDIIKLLKGRMKIFISSEEKLPDIFSEFKINIPPALMHDALFYATLFVGEGATMASEAGVLGTPSIYVNSLIRQYNEDQEKYGLVYNFRDGKNVYKKIEELLLINNIKNIWKEKKERLLEDKINVTDYLLHFIKNYNTKRQ